MVKSKWMCALGAAVATGAVQAVDLENHLWFFADFDSPATLNGGALETRLPEGDGVREPGYVSGRFGRGYAFLAVSNRPPATISESSPEALGEFPLVRGTMSWWAKTPEGIALDLPCGIYNGAIWWNGETFRRWKDSGGWLYWDRKCQIRSHEWAHYAFVWDEDKIFYYVNGQLAQKIHGRKYFKSVKEFPTPWTLTVGASGHKVTSANAHLDEFAILDIALSSEEVGALAAAKTPLFDGAARLVATNPRFPYFYRNEPNAALRMELFAPADGVYALSGEVGGIAIPGGKVRVKKGKNDFDVPFEVRRHAPGEYAWTFALKDARGVTRLAKSGRLKVMRRFERDGYKVLSWGPHASISNMQSIGINCANSFVREHRFMTQLLDAGMGLSARSVNWRTFLPLDFDEQTIVANCNRELEPVRGLHSWTMTLQNTEYFCFGHLPYAKLLESSWRPYAEKSFGGELPPAKIAGTNGDTFGTGPMYWRGWHRKGYNFTTDVPGGVTNIPEIAFGVWFYREGNPMYLGDKITQKEIRRLSPGNVCWAEPLIEAWNLGAHHDLVCDWLYNYFTSKTLAEIYHQYGELRALGKPYMPLPSMGYEHDAGLGVKHPTRKMWNGKPAYPNPAKTADEVLLNCWISIGAVPAHALGFFDPKNWESAIADTPVPRASPKDPEVFGRVFKAKLLPAAELLQDMPNVRAPIAFACPKENDLISGWCERTHYSRYLRLMARTGVAFDVLGAQEFTRETYAKYRYVLFPNARLFTPEQAREIEATQGTKFVFDGRCPKDLFPRYEHFNVWPMWQSVDWKLEREVEKADVDMLNWISNHVDEVHALMPARSDQDRAFGSLTFLKEYAGAKYAIVVNDARQRLADGAQELYNTNAWYKPHGAPQRIRTVLPVFKGGATYVFNEPAKKFLGLFSSPDNKDVVELDYAPAEAKVFCLYPKKLDAPKVEIDGERLKIRIEDADGALAPGRQLLDVTVFGKGGKTRDESGRYKTEGGRATVPLYVDDASRSAFAHGEFRYRVKDLVTGLETEGRIK